MSELAIMLTLGEKWVETPATKSIVLLGASFLTVLIAVWITSDYHKNRVSQYLADVGIKVLSIRHSDLDEKIVVDNSIWTLLVQLNDISRNTINDIAKTALEPSGYTEVQLRIDAIRTGYLGIYVKKLQENG
jgi:hypothetical protein